MKTRLARIGNAIVRFDDVPGGVSSPLFEEVNVETGRLLVHEACFRRALTVPQFERWLAQELEGELGGEVRRLTARGLSPVLHVGFSCLVSFGYAGVMPYFVKSLARQHRHLELNSVAENGDIVTAKLSRRLIEIAAAFGCKIEF